MKRTLMIAVALAVLPTVAQAQGEIAERLGKPIAASFESAKPAYDLELCVADAVAVYGSPIVLRDGPDNLQMVVAQGSRYPLSITFTRVASGTRLDLRGDDRDLRSRLSRCTSQG